MPNEFTAKEARTLVERTESSINLSALRGSCARRAEVNTQIIEKGWLPLIFALAALGISETVFPVYCASDCEIVEEMLEKERGFKLDYVYHPYSDSISKSVAFSYAYITVSW